METIETELTTKAEQLIAQLGWQYNIACNGEERAVQVCPFCNNSNNKFYVHVGGERDGCYDCKVCGQVGNYYQLRNKLGLTTPNLVSLKDTGNAKAGKAELPDFNFLSNRLLNAENPVIDYLFAERKLSMEVIERFKLGAEEFNGEWWAVIPYFDAARNPVFYKARSVPPAKKAFRAPAGREVPLFNQACLKPGMEELLIVEGEMDCLSVLSQGYESVVGVPGAAIKKAIWIDQLDTLQPKTIYLLYDNDKPGQDGAKEIATRIGLERVKNVVLPPFEVDGRPGKDVNEWFCAGHTWGELSKLMDEAKQYDVTGVQNVADVLVELKQDLEERGTTPKYLTPWPSLNKKVGGFEDGDLVGIIAEGKVGKAQPLHCKVKTLTGWKSMEQLTIGDCLASIDGLPSFVTGTFPQGEREVYSITFGDGRNTFCCGDHLWLVSGSLLNGSMTSDILTTKEIDCALRTEKRLIKRDSRLYIPLFSGEFGSATNDLVLDAWLLGLLLGDGCLCGGTPRLRKDNEAILQRVESIVFQYGCKITRMSDGGGGCYISKLVPKPNIKSYLSIALNALGLAGADCFAKFIPPAYLEAPRNVRLELLKGLLDTDGTVSLNGSVSFSSSSPALAEGLKTLVRSLGGMAHIKCKERPKYTYKGRKLVGQPNYTVRIRGLDKGSLFTVESKQKRSAKFPLRPTRKMLAIDSISYWNRAPVKCISVSHPSGLYITDDYIVTHNTTLAMNMQYYYAAIEGHSCLDVCLEMSPKRSVRKLVSHVMQSDDTPGKSQLTTATVDETLKVVAGIPGDLLFGYTKSKNPNEVFSMIRQAVRRYGVKVVCLDHLHLLCQSIEHQSQEVAKLSVDIKNLAMELNVLFLLIIQPNRVGEGQIVSARNALGSSTVEKLVDYMVCLHRNRIAKIKESDFNGFLETDDNLEPHMLVRVDLSRYSSGGCCTLYMDGAKSTVRECVEAEAITQQRSVGIPTEPQEI